jgi:hypothetical protein
MMHPAPIALFVYNRPDHTRRTVEALVANRAAAESELFIFADAPKTAAAAVAVGEVRAYIRSVTGFARVTLVERDANAGLAQSIVEGVSLLTAKYGRVIVLEDDLVTAPEFLAFMNAGLQAYEDVPGVLSICGYMYPLVFAGGPETVFLRAPHSWGWATWEDQWSLFRRDGAALLRELKERRLLAEFDANGPHDYTRMLKDQIMGRNDSWFIRWYAASLLADRVSLYPARSLVSNVGIDGSGVHCAEWRFDPYAVALHEDQVRVDGRTPAESVAVKADLARYYRRVRLLRYVNFAYRKFASLRRRLMPFSGSARGHGAAGR